MTSDPIIQRVRRTNPASATPIENAALLEAIVAMPPDARLTQDAHARTRRHRSRPTWILTVGAVLSIGGATAWATGVTSPLGLFQSSPNDVSQSTPWQQDVIPQDVIPSSVHRATTTTIPNVGEAELWFARTRQGGFCTAIRLPDGHWAGTQQSPLDAGRGSVPGCQPTRSQVNDAAPASIFVITGFDYNDVVVNAPGPGGNVWRVIYGTVDGAQTPVRVVDRVSGRSAPVAEGHLFALAVRDPYPKQLKEHGLRLVALDAHGRVVAGDPRAAG